MRWFDQAANACAASWTGVPGLTSYVAAIRFRRAVVVGDRLEVSARIVHTGPRSVHIGVRVTTSDVVTGAVHIAAEGLVVVATLDEQGRARHVPHWSPGSAEDIRLDRHAEHLVELRGRFEPYPTATGFPPPLVDQSPPVNAASKNASSSCIARR
jgi:4-hydroxybenzoyl-CoA thioesterase